MIHDVLLLYDYLMCTASFWMWRRFILFCPSATFLQIISNNRSGLSVTVCVLQVAERCVGVEALVLTGCQSNRHRGRSATPPTPVSTSVSAENFTDIKKYQNFTRKRFLKAAVTTSASSRLHEEEEETPAATPAASQRLCGRVLIRWIYNIMSKLAAPSHWNRFHEDSEGHVLITKEGLVVFFICSSPRDPSSLSREPFGAPDPQVENYCRQTLDKSIS